MMKFIISLTSLLVVALLISPQLQVIYPAAELKSNSQANTNLLESSLYDGGYAIGPMDPTWWSPNLIQTTSTDHDGDGYNDSDDDHPFNPAIPLNYNSPKPYEEIPKNLLSVNPSWKEFESTNTIDIEWSDVNADGYLDMIVANTGVHGASPEVIQLFLNNRGYFNEYPSWAMKSNLFSPITPIDIELVDMDGDLDAELILAAELDDGFAVSIYENKDDAFFGTAQQTLYLESIPVDIEWGDIDNDGNLDLIVGFSDGIEIYFWEDNQSMSDWNMTEYLSPNTIFVGKSYNIADMELGDLDRDGDLDIALAIWGYHSMVLMNENASFSDVVIDYHVDNAYSITIGDINGNGFLDVVLGTSGPYWCKPSCGEINKLFFFDADNGWYSESSWNPSWINEDNWGTTDYTNDVNLGDIDRDGDLDLIVGNTGADKIYLNHNGNFANEAIWISLESEDTTNTDFVDINADGYLELVTGTYSGKNRIYINNVYLFEDTPTWASGDNTYNAVAISMTGTEKRLALANENTTEIFIEPWSQIGEEPAWESGVTYPSALEWGDVNQDGDDDLIIMNRRMYNFTCACFEGGSDQLYLSENGTLQSNPDWVSTSNESSYSVDLIDVDNDGYIDLVIQGTMVHFYLNSNGDGFQGVPNYSIDVGYSETDFGDINGDGYVDLLVANQTSLAIYINDNGTYFSSPEWKISASGYTSTSFIDVDSDGDLDVSATPDSNFDCADGSIIDRIWVNDGYSDCSDGSDEGVTDNTYKHNLEIFLNTNGQLSQQPIWTISSWEDTVIGENEIITEYWDPQYSVIEWIDLDSDGISEMILDNSDIYCKVPMAIDYQYCDRLNTITEWKEVKWIDLNDDGYLDALAIDAGYNDELDTRIAIFQSILDNDRDGFSDQLDEFPFDPTQVSDRDGDSFGDNELGFLSDDCPFTYGNSHHIIRGCVDIDSDGYGDIIDDCLTIFGTSSIGMNGCPDSDTDGLPDLLDLYFGYTGGNAVDWDADGWLNSEDAFPTQRSQWRDSDGDGFGDNYNDEHEIFERPTYWPGELVPNATFVDWFPQNSEAWDDSDRDGYTDQRSTNITDDCPTVSGNSTISLKGCPDFDGDGMPDILDSDIDGDGIFNTWEYQNGNDPFDNLDFPLDTDKDGIPDNSDDDDDNDGFPDAVELSRGSDPKSAESDPMSDYGGGFYYVPGEGFEPGYHVEGFEISFGALMHIIKSELIIPILSSIFALYIIGKKKRVFKSIRKEIEQIDSEENLGKLELGIEESVANKKITVLHALLLRSIIERKKITLSNLVAYVKQTFTDY
jgi:hypothetical protein